MAGPDFLAVATTHHENNPKRPYFAGYFWTDAAFLVCDKHILIKNFCLPVNPNDHFFKEEYSSQPFK